MKFYFKFKERFEDMKTFPHYLITINEVRIMSGFLCKVFFFGEILDTKWVGCIIVALVGEL
jgi:hypothetical protein